MSELHQDFCVWPYVEASLLNAHLLRLGNQLQLILRAGLGGQHWKKKQQDKREQDDVSLFHSYPWAEMTAAPFYREQAAKRPGTMQKLAYPTGPLGRLASYG